MAECAEDRSAAAGSLAGDAQTAAGDAAAAAVVDVVAVVAVDVAAAGARWRSVEQAKVQSLRRMETAEGPTESRQRGRGS